MKIRINDIILTDECTIGRKKCLLDYFWLGFEESEAHLATFADGDLKKIKRSIERIERKRKKRYRVGNL